VPLRLAIALVALIVLATATVAVASTYRWGILDLFNTGSPSGEASPDAAALVVTPPVQVSAHTDWADISIEEYAYDGQFLMLSVSVTALKDNSLLIPAGHGHPFPGLEMSYLSPYYADEKSTIADYVQSHGLEVFRYSLETEQSSRYRSPGTTPNPSGGGWIDNTHLVLPLAIELDPDEGVPDLIFTIYPVTLMPDGSFSDVAYFEGGAASVEKDDDGNVIGRHSTSGDNFHLEPPSNAQTVRLSLGIKAGDGLDESYEMRTLVNVGPAVFDEYGITVDELRIKCSPFGAYVTAQGRTADVSRLLQSSGPTGELYPEIPRMDISAEDGTVLFPVGSLSMGVSVNGDFEISGSLPAMDIAAGKLVLTMDYQDWADPDNTYAAQTAIIEIIEAETR
jgi:hypothetical protein